MIQAIIAALVAAGLILQAPRTNIVDLAIGDPARKDRTVKLGVDRPIDTRDSRAGDGTEIAAGDVAQRLRDTRILLIGESHTSRESHRVQFQVIEALHRAGRRVIIGLEMYP